MQHYQLLVLVPGNVSEEDSTAVVGEVTSLIQAEEGTVKIVNSEGFGKRRLAYPIKGLHYGYYTVVEFDVEQEKLAKIDQEIRHNARVLRHLCVVAVEKSEEQRLKEQALRERLQVKRRQTQEDVKRKEREERVKEVTKPEAYKGLTDAERKATIEELDKKLDEIMSDDIMDSPKNP